MTKLRALHQVHLRSYMIKFKIVASSVSWKWHEQGPCVLERQGARTLLDPATPPKLAECPCLLTAVHMNVNMPHPTPPPQYMKIGSGNLIGNHHIKIIRKTWIILDLVDSWGLPPSSNISAPYGQAPGGPGTPGLSKAVTYPSSGCWSKLKSKIREQE